MALASALSMRARIASIGTCAAGIRRLHSFSSPRSPAGPVGVAFDIDGVLLRGHHPLPHARESLLRLAAADVPFIFLTNGGGERESKKASKLEEVLELPVATAQVVLSHTPLRQAVAAHAHEKILVLGCRDVVDVAHSYGATRVYTVDDLARDEPTRYPFLHWEQRRIEPAAERDAPFGAVFILHDPNNWGAEIQIALDVIRGGSPLGSGRGQAVPVYASNPDLVFAGAYPVSRLAAGAFTLALRALFREVTGGAELAVTQVGKPSAATFACAAETLAAWRSNPERRRLYGAGGPALGVPLPLPTAASGFRRILMVGDNPAGDIRGATAAGQPWLPVLVRTGIFQGTHGSNDARDPAAACVAGVREAVDVALAEARASSEAAVGTHRPRGGT